jgi:DNA replication regulator DPB11
VSLEWFEQSLERGMVLDETFYNPTIPVAERGHGAWDRREFSSPAAGKRPRDTEPSQALNPFRRKLRRSASTKMGTQSEALWAGITAGSFERQQDDGDDWTEDIVLKQDTTRAHAHEIASTSSGPEAGCDLRRRPCMRTSPATSAISTPERQHRNWYIRVSHRFSVRL